MTTDKNRLRYLFERYTSGISTQEEKEELMLFISQSSNRTDLDLLMEEMWDGLQQAPYMHPEKADKIFNTILRKKKTFFFNTYRIAAALLIAIIAAGAVYYSLNTATAKTIRKKTVSTNDHRQIRLPDGSTVILKEDSELIYPESFLNEQSREVTLIGEGFFDIAHDAQKPFIVHTGKVHTTVLGTAFNIKAYQNDSEITVTVRRGKVQVSDNDRLIGVITQDQQITFDRQSNAAEQKHIESKETVAWAEQDLFFNDMTLAEAASHLEKRFGVTINFANEKVSQCRFTATFIKGESLDEVLEVICEFNHATFEKPTRSDIVIDGSGC